MRMSFGRTADRELSLFQISALALFILAAIALIGCATCPDRESAQSESGPSESVQKSIEESESSKIELFELKPTPIASALPDWMKTETTLMGGSKAARKALDWQLATVIISIEDSDGEHIGHGSGVAISTQGWILTNFHVVESVVQDCSLTGEIPKVSIITCEKDGGRARRREGSLSATVFRVSPTLDLALVRLDALPFGVPKMNYLKIAEETIITEDCFAIGSPGGGVPWSIRAGNVSGFFMFPEGLTDAVIVNAGAKVIANQRTHVETVSTDCSVSAGDSGGPLVNSEGEIIGLNFAIPAEIGGSTGFHITAREIRSFVDPKNLPATPERAPFDIWRAGLTGTAGADFRLQDMDGNGKRDTLQVELGLSAEFGPFVGTISAASVYYVDFDERASIEAMELDPLKAMPMGLWGMPSVAKFHYDVVVVSRYDDVVAIGYTDEENMVVEIRVDGNDDGYSDIVWARENTGLWGISTALLGKPVVDSVRLGDKAGMVGSILEDESLE